MPETGYPKCDRCGHRADDHTFDSAQMCIICDCPDMVFPADAGWPYSNAPELAGAVA